MAASVQSAGGNGSLALLGRMRSWWPPASLVVGNKPSAYCCACAHSLAGGALNPLLANDGPGNPRASFLVSCFRRFCACSATAAGIDPHRMPAAAHPRTRLLTDDAGCSVYEAGVTLT